MQLNVLLSSWHSGPLPPAHVLEGYNRVVPDGAERVFRMAEKSLDHQVTIESKLADGSILLAKRAQVWAGVIAILGFLLAGYLAHEGTSGWAFAVAALDVSAIVGYFLGARYITSRPPPQPPPGSGDEAQ